jgi:hypothetical protein
MALLRFPIVKLGYSYSYYEGRNLLRTYTRRTLSPSFTLYTSSCTVRLVCKLLSYYCMYVYVHRAPYHVCTCTYNILSNEKASYPTKKKKSRTRDGIPAGGCEQAASSADRDRQRRLVETLLMAVGCIYVCMYVCTCSA